VGARQTADTAVADRYVRREPLGHGGFGVVWRAHDSLLQRDVAIKEIHFPELLGEEEKAHLRERVLREARAAARLSHPGAVTVFDVIEEDGQPFIVMELVDAPTLAEVVERDGPLDVRRAAALGVGMLDALTAAHAHGIVHRDVKPANVMVHESGRVQLADFGIASIIDDPKVTSSGHLAGSPSYMAPEQAENRPAGASTDLWGLGATLYFAVEGEPPFERDGAIATLASVVTDEPRPMRRAGALTPLLRDLLNKDPAARPTTGDVGRRLLDLTADSADPTPTAELDASAIHSAVTPPAPDHDITVTGMPPVTGDTEPSPTPAPPPPAAAPTPPPAPTPAGAWVRRLAGVRPAWGPVPCRPSPGAFPSP